MPEHPSPLSDLLRQQPKIWLVTGVAGFIGHHLLQTLLHLDQTVVGLDNLATGHRSNLQTVQSLVTPAQWGRFRLIKGDIRAPGDCHRACDGVDHVVHLAALGSVKRSLADPITTNNTNVCGFVNMLVAAQEAAVSSFTYATCSSTYGQPAGALAAETQPPQPLSPYAASKQINELYADVFARSLGMPSIGLRLFNVYGPRQDPDNAHAYPLVQWIVALQRGQAVYLDSAGPALCDLTHVYDAVQAILRAATAPPEARNQVYNVASGQSVHLLSLLAQLQRALSPVCTDRARTGPSGASSLVACADISKARQQLGYEPTVSLAQGLADTLAWYRSTSPASPRPTTASPGAVTAHRQHSNPSTHNTSRP
jgi:UDP-N-acetylglucosamine 4-epimerase